jgi:hypothetical protein
LFMLENQNPRMINEKGEGRETTGTRWNSLGRRQQVKQKSHHSHLQSLTDDVNFRNLLQFLSTHAKFDDSQAIPGGRFKHGYY